MHFYIFEIVNHFANLLANRRPPRLARWKYCVALLTQILDKGWNVRGLAGTFWTLKSDEHEESIQVDRYKCKQVNKPLTTCLPVYVCTCVFFHSLNILTWRRGSLP